MSCSSCVGKITAALEQKPWVRSANVALLTQSATVEFDGEQNAEELAKIIDGIGYEARLEHVNELPPAPGAGPRVVADLWKASYSIGGMTCSSCVGTITKALDSLPWAKSVNVNLITNSATVDFEGKSHLNEIIEAIEDVGYTARLSDVVNLSKDKAQDGRRAVSIAVDGMYCQHCPSRVAEALNCFGNLVTIEKPVTIGTPIMTVSYTPNSPGFTIRAILSAVSAADPAFNPTIYHPPTVEERAAQMHTRIRKRIFYRVLLSLVVAVPAFIIGIVFMTLVPPTNRGRKYLMGRLHGVTRAEWALFIMATPVYFLAADVFHRRSIKELCSLWKRSSPVPILRRFYRFGSMDMLMSFGTTIAYFSSIVELIIAATLRDMADMKGNTTYFDSVVFLTMFLLIGRLIEAYSKAKTGEAVTMLGRLRPKEALLVLPNDGKEGVDRTQNVPIDMLDLGDVVRVVHGGSPPWDGVLLEGEGEFDESSLTGESRLVKKTVGDPIYSGTVNKGGPIVLRTTGVSGDSMLDQIIRVVREGQARRAPIERVADMLTSYFVPVVTLIAVSTWLIWLSLGLSGTLPEEYLDVEIGSWPFWSLQFAIAVFIIACPCGIGLAAPTALFVGGGLAAKHGILVKGGGEAFQEASGLDIIVFDKTGTLTQGGEPKITDHQFLGSDESWEEQTIVNILRELEGNSSHPLGRAIVGFCESRNATGAKAGHMEEIAGKGMKGTFNVATLSHPIEMLAGNEALMTDHGISFGSTTSASLHLWKGQAKSVVLVAARAISSAGNSPWRPVAIFAASDPLRPESRLVVEALHRQGIDIWMISGDNPTTAYAVGAMVDIPTEHIIAGVLPEQKADKIKYLQKSQVKSSSRSFLGLASQRTKQRAIVAMVGDGVNDSPALTVADVGIAIGSGSDVAISAAEFVLIKSSLSTLLTLVSLSRTVFRRVKFNFGWALVYNLVALPIAAGVLYPVRSNGRHIRLDPVWASLAMALSSVSVICSSLLLRSRLPLVGFRDSKTSAEDTEEL
ncbi:putative copper resistance-associated p-type atpase protein [Phaeoacremonium minimum UCRPA7]|uniref:Putative copper resistance-associated P-type atpase protein n=1 Tax=Phaeoacremonium minimum (strain UCR-PA7) TaxID=1286976 RepID=R8B925_PHAM7|nr:putative copper resistance-associated p-type atpase protein [Phaeoacremonium minimum UCRPA7]EON95801.1 putative copper resistance-associated p-type atpase protein [Phaeoacremonium minimum UCRPA7]